MKISDTTEMMRNMEVNNRKQGNIKLIDTLFSRVDDDIYEDDLHLNQIGATRLIKDMDSRIGGYERRTSNNRKNLQQGRDRMHVGLQFLL